VYTAGTVGSKQGTTMRLDEFATMRSLEETHWWFVGRRSLLREVLCRLRLRNALILDAGCGTGYAGRELRRAGTVVGLDICREVLGKSAAGGSETPGNEPYPVLNCVALIEDAPFPGGTFDLVVALDLLEHIEDDAAALREICRVMKPGGYVLIAVPACPGLWSHHDEVLGHRRRYTIQQVVRKSRAAGLAPIRASHFVTGVFPLAALYRILRKSAPANRRSDLSAVPEPLNSLLASLLRIESSVLFRICLPFGLSVVLLARKDA